MKTRCRRGCGRWRGARWSLPGAAVLLSLPCAAAAQTMPGPAYHDLVESGHERLARRISARLELRADPDAEDVTSLIDRWTREEGGPNSGYDWLTVTRLWLRAGEGARAELSLHNAEDSGGVPAALLLLDQARVAFLVGQAEVAERAYWKGCELAGEAGSIEYWLDVEPLATPEELGRWDRFRRLPVGQRDLCAFLRRLWSERALASGLTITGRMQVHHARMRYALNNYRRRSGKKGPTFSNRLGRPQNAAFDDRGLVFLRMGSPDRTTRFSGNPGMGRDLVSAECYQPNESWAYDYPDATRVFHFTAFGGIDDYWLIENLGLVYRCGGVDVSPSGSAAGLSPLNENLLVTLAPSASLVLQDLYRSRHGLDPRYAAMAQRMAADVGTDELRSGGSEALEARRVLQEERDWMWEDGRFLVEEIPGRPAVATNARLLFEELQFRSPNPGHSRVWLNGLIEADRLRPASLADGHLRYRVRATWGLLGDDGEYRYLTSSFETVATRQLGTDESLPVRMAVDLLPGRYRYSVVVRDASGEATGEARAGNYRRGTLTVREFDIGAPALSDVAVAADSGGNWSPAVGAALRASPAHLTGADGVAYVFFEAYNLAPRAAHVTRVRLAPQDGGEAFELSFPGDGLSDEGSATRRLLRLDLTDTDPGVYTMTVTVRDEETGLETLPYNTRITVNRAQD